MKISLRLIVGTMGLLAFAASAQMPGKTVPAPFKTALEATSYAVGVDMVRNFKSQSVSFDQTQLIQGIKDASAGDKVLLSDADVRSLVSTLEGEVRTRMMAARKVEADANLIRSEAFLQSNGARADVVTLGSGVQYRIKKAGQGSTPGDDATVLANFKGMLVDGTVFDASEPGKPAAIKLAQVIPGWREALKRMPAGSTWEITLPPNLAYGERGAGRVIGPNQALRFDVELVEIR